jgi:LuxR family transcriptional regulator, maltose regulon positive regulatory protein
LSDPTRASPCLLDAERSVVGPEPMEAREEIRSRTGARLQPAQSPPLLATKFHPPPTRKHTVTRERLAERLRAGPGTSLTLVAAPAGCGKTTLLGAWCRSEETARPIAWLTLDEGDNDLVVLWSYVLEALRRVCPELNVSASPERVGGARIMDTVLPELVNELTALGDAALVLDDFHQLSSGPARDSVTWFIDHVPSTFQLVIATRSEPALRLASLRAHGALVELRASDLGFTSSEADLLLNDRLELGLDREYVEDLVDRTEGWPAALYLAALSIQGAIDRSAVASRFGGGSRHVVDFLVDEVLGAHDPAMQALMLRSSILERLCGPLCDAVLEQEGARARLDALSRTNLFLVPLDDEGEWYRFHNLFRQLLRVELEHREPGLTPALHRRAFAWHRDNGLVEEAIRHAQEAGAFTEALDEIASVYLRFAATGRHAPVLAWLERFPPELRHKEPRLLVMKADMYAIAGNHDEAVGAVRALERLRGLEAGPMPDGSPSLEAFLARQRGGWAWGDVNAGFENALLAAELHTPESPMWADVCWSLGMGCYYRGDLDGADRWFDETVEVGRSSGLWLVTTSGLAHRSLIVGERGEPEDQRLLAEEAVGLAQECGVEEIRGEVHVAMGVSLAARDELDDALLSLAHGVAILRSSGDRIQLANALIHHASVLRAAGDREGSPAAIAEARATVDSCPDPGILRERLATLERSARPSPRRAESGPSERELVILRMLSGSLSERDIGRELYLSYNTIHSHTRSIYRKLGVSSRAEALERARELGLV